MSDHADVIRETIREAREGAILTAEEVRVGLAALDALVAERDEAQRLAVQATEEAEKYRKQAGVTEYHQLRRTHTEKRLADEEDRADMAEARVAELEKALGGFIWLDNNRHNIGTPTWTGFFVAAVDDARAALAAKEGT